MIRIAFIPGDPSLPADVIWGSFVTHSFLPKDVCGEATETQGQSSLHHSGSLCRHRRCVTRQRTAVKQVFKFQVYLLYMKTIYNQIWLTCGLLKLIEAGQSLKFLILQISKNEVEKRDDENNSFSKKKKKRERERETYK